MTEVTTNTPLWRDFILPFVIFLCASITAFIIYWPRYRQVKDLETRIEGKHKELRELPDKLHGRTSNSLVTQGQLDKMIEHESKPIKQDIERLERERRFILEKIPLLSKLTRL